MDHFFFSFTPLKTPQKSKFSKTAGDIIILQKVCQKSWSYAVLFSRYGHDSFFSFWTIYWPFTPWQTKKMKILKKWKQHPEISPFYTCVPKIMIRWCTVPKIWCATDGRTDRQMDGWKKWHIKVGASPKNCDELWKKKQGIFWRWLFCP